MNMGAYRFIPVVLLLGTAAALLTDRSTLPLPIRGIRRALGNDTGGGAAHHVPAWRRWVAFILVLAAFALALCEN